MGARGKRRRRWGTPERGRNQLNKSARGSRSHRVQREAFFLLICRFPACGEVLRLSAMGERRFGARRSDPLTLYFRAGILVRVEFVSLLRSCTEWLWDEQRVAERRNREATPSVRAVDRAELEMADAAPHLASCSPPSHSPFQTHLSKNQV